MSYNIKHVPHLNELIAELTAYPDNLRYYQKAEVLIGPPNSIAYLESLYNSETDDN